ncbi:hypothetical protein PAPYR_12577 [Paratrimastix pyriformis]|uniref:Uncharacterized protein n=1 Tax=Paratrimastix pyriformis TaxID=342808 RepID=A0ABQ8U1N0_9EUKA|nr:hypothetical protein PAPYR_12577 [Paratrimastix pyriformis]
MDFSTPTNIAIPVLMMQIDEFHRKTLGMMSEHHRKIRFLLKIHTAGMDFSTPDKHRDTAAAVTRLLVTRGMTPRRRNREAIRGNVRAEPKSSAADAAPASPLRLDTVTEDEAEQEETQRASQEHEATEQEQEEIQHASQDADQHHPVVFIPSAEHSSSSEHARASVLPEPPTAEPEETPEPEQTTVPEQTTEPVPEQITIEPLETTTTEPEVTTSDPVQATTTEPAEPSEPEPAQSELQQTGTEPEAAEQSVPGEPEQLAEAEQPAEPELTPEPEQTAAPPPTPSKQPPTPDRPSVVVAPPPKPRAGSPPKKLPDSIPPKTPAQAPGYQEVRSRSPTSILATQRSPPPPAAGSIVALKTPPPPASVPSRTPRAAPVASSASRAAPVTATSTTATPPAVAPGRASVPPRTPRAAPVTATSTTATPPAVAPGRASVPPRTPRSPGHRHEHDCKASSSGSGSSFRASQNARTATSSTIYLVWQSETKEVLKLTRQAFYERIFPKLLASWFPSTNHLNRGLIVPVHFFETMAEYRLSGAICVELHKVLNRLGLTFGKILFSMTCGQSADIDKTYQFLTSRALMILVCLDSEAAFGVDRAVDGHMRLDELALWERTFPFYVKEVFHDRSMLELTDYYGEQFPKTYDWSIQCHKFRTNTCYREIPAHWDYKPPYVSPGSSGPTTSFNRRTRPRCTLADRLLRTDLPKLLASWFPNANHLNPGLIVPVHFLKPLTEYHFSAPICVELHKVLTRMVLAFGGTYRGLSARALLITLLLDSEAAFDIDHPIEGVLRDRSLLERTDYYGEQFPKTYDWSIQCHKFRTSTCSRELPTLWDFLLTGPLPLPLPVLVAEPEPVPESVPLPENVPVADDDEDEWFAGDKFG